MLKYISIIVWITAIITAIVFGIEKIFPFFMLLLLIGTVLYYINKQLIIRRSNENITPSQQYTNNRLLAIIFGCSIAIIIYWLKFFLGK